MYKMIIPKLLRIFPKIRSVFYIGWNRFLFKMIKVEYGANMNVRNKIYIIGPGKIRIGKNFTYSSGDNINSVSRNLRGGMHTMTDEAVIEIGDNVGISASCIRSMVRVKIGNNVQIGADCLIMDTDSHPLDYTKRRYDYEHSIHRDSYFQDIPKAPITIDDDVWIGARCIILKGVHIGARSIVAAGSIVTKDVPTDCIVGGNPCRVIKSLYN